RSCQRIGGMARLNPPRPTTVQWSSVKEGKGVAMNARRATLVVLLALVPTLAHATPRQRARVRAAVRANERAREAWELLGEKTVGRNLDHDTIAVTAREGLFRRIRIDVERSGVRIADVKVR